MAALLTRLRFPGPLRGADAWSSTGQSGYDPAPQEVVVDVLRMDGAAVSVGVSPACKVSDLAAAVCEKLRCGPQVTVRLVSGTSLLDDGDASVESCLGPFDCAEAARVQLCAVVAPCYLFVQRHVYRDGVFSATEEVILSPGAPLGWQWSALLSRGDGCGSFGDVAEVCHVHSPASGAPEQWDDLQKAEELRPGDRRPASEVFAGSAEMAIRVKTRGGNN